MCPVDLTPRQLPPATLATREGRARSPLSPEPIVSSKPSTAGATAQKHRATSCLSRARAGPRAGPDQLTTLPGPPAPPQPRRPYVLLSHLDVAHQCCEDPFSGPPCHCPLPLPDRGHRGGRASPGDGAEPTPLAGRPWGGEAWTHVPAMAPCMSTTRRPPTGPGARPPPSPPAHITHIHVGHTSPHELSKARGLLPPRGLTNGPHPGRPSQRHSNSCQAPGTRQEHARSWQNGKQHVPLLWAKRQGRGGQRRDQLGPAPRPASQHAGRRCAPGPPSLARQPLALAGRWRERLHGGNWRGAQREAAPAPATQGAAPALTASPCGTGGWTVTWKPHPPAPLRPTDLLSFQTQGSLGPVPAPGAPPSPAT